MADTSLTAWWARQDDYDDVIRAASIRYGVTVPLIKAVIAKESAFNRLAIRAEAPRPSLPPTPDFPAGGDASYGLMQVLVRTARSLGYTGTKEGLWDAETNVMLGTRLLRDNMRRAGASLADSVSAYNGGFRPSLGFGEPLASGQYGNQAYVDAVMRYLDYFREWEARKGGAGVMPDSFRADTSSGRGTVAVPEQAPVMRFPWPAVIVGLALWAALTIYYLVR